MGKGIAATRTGTALPEGVEGFFVELQQDASEFGRELHALKEILAAGQTADISHIDPWLHDVRRKLRFACEAISDAQWAALLHQEHPAKFEQIRSSIKGKDPAVVPSKNNELGYTGNVSPPEAADTARLPMGKNKTIEAAAKMLSRVYPRKVVEAALADLAAYAARSSGNSRLTRPKMSDDDAVKAVFGEGLPDTFRTQAYTRNPHPELVHHPAVLARAKEIVSANSRTKIADLEPPARETLRQARRIVRANERHPATAPR